MDGQEESADGKEGMELKPLLSGSGFLFAPWEQDE
jgi:hypothetical protein